MTHYLESGWVFLEPRGNEAAGGRPAVNARGRHFHLILVDKLHLPEEFVG